MDTSLANLARSNWWIRSVSTTIGLACILIMGLGFLIWMLVGSVSLQRETDRVNVLSERYAAASKKIDGNVAINQSAGEMKKKLSEISRVVPEGENLEEIMEALEGSHSVGLSLRSLSFDREKGIARVKVVSKEPEQLFAWIEGLASPSDIRNGWDVTLESSEVDDQGVKVYLVHVAAK